MILINFLLPNSFYSNNIEPWKYAKIIAVFRTAIISKAGESVTNP
jgi:hypothetical protein